MQNPLHHVPKRHLGTPDLRGSDAGRFHHIEGRFTSPVLPGEALTVSMWESGDGTALFTTAVDDRVVIDQGLLRYS